MRTVFVAMRNSDLTEGRGPLKPIAAFTRRDDAMEAAKGWGVQGQGDGEVHEMVIYDSFAEFVDQNTNRIRREALLKLNREERKALGLSDR